MDEEYRAIEGYEGMYEISNLGNIRSLDRVVLHNNGSSKKIKGKLLCPSVDSRGYMSIELYKYNKEKNYLIHRLVASAFLPNTNNCNQVNHIDGDKRNNCVSNLEWCTPKQNIHHARMTHLSITTESQQHKMAEASAKARSISVMCKEDHLTFSSQLEAANHYGLSASNVWESINYQRSVKGHTFVKIESKPHKLFNISAPDVERSMKKYNMYCRCIETGQKFKSRGEASRELMIPESSVYDSLRDGRKHRGYTIVNITEQEYNMDESL